MKKFISLFAASLMVISCLLIVSPLSAEAAATIKFQATKIDLRPGVSEISGYFYNSGAVGAKVNTVEIQFEATTPDGEYIFEDSSTFSDVGAWVPANGQKKWTFCIHNENAEGYRGRFKWHCNTHIEW